MSKKITLDDIFDDDEFGMLDHRPKTSNIKSEDDRLMDAFEEINAFVDRYEREPGTASMSEYGLLAKLKNFRQSEEQKKLLKPFDRHDLLGHVELEKPSLDDILNEDDELGLLETDEELSIFKFKHTPKPQERADADFVAQRKPLSEKEFEPYEAMFQKVHKELKEGTRKVKPFINFEKNLRVGGFYIMDGLLVYLEAAELEKEERNLHSGNRVRTEGRTRTIFENGTYSNMLFRSLGKQIQKSGKLITDPAAKSEYELFVNANLVQEEDENTGFIYVLKSLSKHPKIASIKDLYKIGYSSVDVDKRIGNAKNEATYLFADVHKVAVYQCYNRNADKLEALLHRFFAEACLDIDLFNEKGQRLNPREWFVVPFEVIDQVIPLILKETILNYRYDPAGQRVVLKPNG